MTDQTPKDKLLDAALPHVAFDGWSPETFAAAAKGAGYSVAEARSICPRGAIDLAVHYHRRGDDEMTSRLAEADLSEMRFRDKVATALRFRVDAMTDREAVRRASTLFALPQNVPESARLVWETADKVWTALGDRSDDVNWYSKRATLSAVWASVVLFWLGDDSPDQVETGAFIDRRIDDVMQIEKAKASLRKNPIGKLIADGAGALFAGVRAPSNHAADDLPGRWTPPGT